MKYSGCIGLKHDKFSIISEIRWDTGRHKKTIVDRIVAWHKETKGRVSISEKEKGACSEYATVAISYESYSYIERNSDSRKIPSVRVMDKIMEDAINEGIFSSGGIERC